jgi:hypothetical protein
MDMEAEFTIQDLNRFLEQFYSEYPSTSRYSEYSIGTTTYNFYKTLNWELDKFSPKIRMTRRSKQNKKKKKKQEKYIPKEITSNMNKKLRLLVTAKCHNECPLCYNKQFDLGTLPIVDRWDYEEIMITGGEPLSSLKKVRFLINLIESVKIIQQAQGFPVSKFYVYTATRHTHLLFKILRYVDGITYTPHNAKEMDVMNEFTLCMMRTRKNLAHGKSFKLNLFSKDYEAFESVHMLQPMREFWEVKKIEWLKECPLPEGEDFKRIYMPY